VIERLESDDAVIFVGLDAAEVGAAVRAADDHYDRVAGLIGERDDPVVRAALDEMRDELFGSGADPQS
jgi:hypothetical protein